MATQLKEIYKDIPDYEGLYQISNLGNVKSVERIITTSAGWSMKIKGKIMKPTKVGSNREYVGYRIYKECKGYSFLAHAMVARVFMNHEPDGHVMVIDHISGDTTDNSVQNLQIITHRENLSKERPNTTSKYTGIHKVAHSGKYYARITYNGLLYYLGTFVEEIDAHCAYQKALNNINRGKLPRIYKRQSRKKIK